MLDDLVEQGIEAIDLAAAYHPIESLSPRSGTRLYVSPRGAVHFPARSERYGRIKPSTSSTEICATWPAVVNRVADLGIAVNAWTVTLFQPWIIDEHPDCARVLANGDAVGSGVCPANEDVREYLANLCDDVADQFDVHLVRLESIMPLGYDVDWLRPRVLVDVPRIARDLLTICFCDACVRRGTDVGLDVVRLRQLVAAEIVDQLSGDTAANQDAIAEDPELQEFLAQHERASIELASVVASRLVGSPAKIASTIRTPFRTLRRHADDHLTEQLAEVVDQLAVSPLGARNRRIAAIAASASHEVELSMLITRGLRFGSIRSPDKGEVDPLPEQLDEAVALGVAEVGLYNYGLLPDEEVRIFMAEVRSALARPAPDWTIGA